MTFPTSIRSSKKIKTIELIVLLQAARRSHKPSISFSAVSILSFIISRAMLWDEWVVLPDDLRKTYDRLVDEFTN